jgi:predicted DNA-binding ribbon-helix-helix protein
MKSMIAKRSIMINNHKTSVSLEDEFWGALKEIALQRNQRLSALIAHIDSERTTGNLSSALRLFVLDQYRSSAGGAVRPDKAVSTAA